MKKNKILLFTFIFLALSFFSTLTYQIWTTNLPLISPLDLITPLPPFSSSTNSSSKMVLGFLPYWNLKYSNELNIKSLTHLAYFGVELNEFGEIKKFSQPGELEPGWNKFNSDSLDLIFRQLRLTHKKPVLVIKAFNKENIRSLLNTPTYRHKAISSIVQLLQEKQTNFVNIDFETSSISDSQTRNNFTLFIKELKQQNINTSPLEISIDIFANAAKQTFIWDLSALEPHTDHFIVMAYDFYRPSSTQAGPVSPLRGKCPSTNFLEPPSETCLEEDITSSIADITQIIPPHKVILGIPFYGYQWQTASDNFLANTYSQTGSTATYRYIQGLFDSEDISSLSASWSALSQTPYLNFYQQENLYQLHYDNPYSLSLKIDLVNQAGLGGIAIWALGYEVPYSDLWQTISQQL